MVALFFGMVVFLGFKFPTDLPLTFCTCWLAAISLFLIIRRNVPIRRHARTIFLLNFGLCIGLLVLAGIPLSVTTRATSSADPCVNNLRQIDAAANQFALEHHLTNGSPINFPGDLTPYIKLDANGKIPSCPSGGIYHLSKVGENPTCSLGTTVTPGHVLP